MVSEGVRDSSVSLPTLFAVYINGIVSKLPFSVHRFSVLHAYDISLMAPSVTKTLCEIDLKWLMAKNDH